MSGQNEEYTNDLSQMVSEGIGGEDTNYAVTEQSIPSDEDGSLATEEAEGYDRGVPIAPPVALAEEPTDPPPPEPAAPEAPVAGAEPLEGEEPVSGDEPEPGKKRTASERIQGLVTDVKDLKGTNTQLSSENAELNARLQALEAHAAAPQPAAAPAVAEPEAAPVANEGDEGTKPDNLPKLKDFWIEETGEYDMDGWASARDAVNRAQWDGEQNQKAEATKASAAFETMATSFTEKETAFVATLEDKGSYSASSQAVIGALSSGPQSIPVVLNTILQSEFGPQVVNELGIDIQGFQQELLTGNIGRVLTFIGRAEERVRSRIAPPPASGEAPASSPENAGTGNEHQQQPTPQAAVDGRVSGAPAPPAKAPASSAPPSDDLGNLSIEEYAERRGLNNLGW